MSEKSHQRPLLITILGAVIVLLGLFLIIGGAALHGTDVSTLIDQGLDPDIANNAGAIGIVLMVFGILYLIVAAGFFQGWSFIWYLGIVVMAIGLVSNLYYTATGMYTNIIAVIIDLIIIYYLFRPNVKEYFLGHE
ncbi:MAG: hypothetical protein Q4Q58_05445 [Thermoplasmata archaeon]|nr:hypothetical protein [Thermoplasmata archaeon]